jgi:protein kinase-like protein
MPSFFERVRAALAQKGYQVEGDRELGNGGMGIVVLARQSSLNRLVAVKVIRPDFHTAIAVARFVREARTLADLRHDHIVQVFDAGDAGEFPFYAMEYLVGDTVADRIRGGAIPPADVLHLGCDLLDALAYAHEHGVVHRDVKPGNLFWDGKKAVLVDFGIAQRLPREGETREEPLTDTGRQLGTRAYMPPEGVPSPAGDVYAAALVIYEAYTARHWLEPPPPGASRWDGVPYAARALLRRGLDRKPQQRPSAATFRYKLWETQFARPRLWVAAVLLAMLFLGGLSARQWIYEAWPFHHPGGLRLIVSSFVSTCAATGAGDRLAEDLVRDLQGYADFSVSGPMRSVWFKRRSTLVVRGTICARGAAVRGEITIGIPGAPDPTIVARADSDQLNALADTLSYGLVREIWNRENPFDPVLPLKALPRSGRGLAAWLVAERLFAQARWGSADSAYAVAEALDSTCLLCFWRHAEVDKWLSIPLDAERAAHYVTHIDSFPSHYQALIRASLQPPLQSLATLKEVVHERPAFLPALFMLADETYHRGPMVGLSLRDAIDALQDVVQHRPDFLPATEHLTWAQTAAGHDTAARNAFRRLPATGPTDDFYTQEVRALLRLGLVCRFESRSACQQAIDAALGQVGAAQYPDLAAGPRYLMTFDAPTGAVDFGRRFEAKGDAPGLAESGLVAEMSGYLALGLPDSALRAAQSLRGFGGPELTVLPAELAAALSLLDPLQPIERSQWGTIVDGLIAHTRSSVSTAPTRRRAAWMLLLLERRQEQVPESEQYFRLLRGEPGRQLLTTLLAADGAARAGQIDAALRLTDSLTPLRAGDIGEPEAVDPFFRTVLHLFRADWYSRRHDTDGVVRELQWYENNDVSGRLSGAPQVADMDWGFSTLARWRLARLLDGSDPGRACDLYRRVGNLWESGDLRYRARADSARARVAALHCAAAA